MITYSNPHPLSLRKAERSHTSYPEIVLTVGDKNSVVMRCRGWADQLRKIYWFRIVVEDNGRGKWQVKEHLYLIKSQAEDEDWICIRSIMMKKIIANNSGTLPMWLGVFKCSCCFNEPSQHPIR